MTKMNRVKNAIVQVTYFLNSSMFNFVILFYIERMWLFMRNLTAILPLKSKSYYLSGTKVFLRINEEIYRYTDICIQCASRQFLAVKKWCSANVFSDTKQKYICWKICKLRKAFGCVAGVYYFQCQMSWGP